MFFTERENAVKKNKRTGFTLIELLVVIAIIALLLAILIPSLNRAKDSAQRVVCGNGLKQVGAAVRMYADGYDNLLGVDRIGDQVDGHPYVLYRADKTPWNVLNPLTNRYVPLRLACLFERKFIADPKVFYCPGNIGWTYRYESYVNPSPWGSLPQEENYEPPRGHGNGNQWVRMGYSYYPTDRTAPMILDMAIGALVPEETTTRFDRLDATIPYITDTIWSRSGLSHKAGMRTVKEKNNKLSVILLNPGINSLFKDGHVVYCNDRSVFTNAIWNLWEPPNGDPARITYPAFYYTIFNLISP
jgi:prepilin-type N-terminal cleavage/methylation domain-containing protein